MNGFDDLYKPSETQYNFYRYYDDNDEYIVDLKVNEQNYIEVIKIMTDDSQQGNKELELNKRLVTNL